MTTSKPRAPGSAALTRAYRRQAFESQRVSKGEKGESSTERLLTTGRKKHFSLRKESVLESRQKRTQGIQEKVLEPLMIEKSD